MPKKKELGVPGFIFVQRLSSRGVGSYLNTTTKIADIEDEDEPVFQYQLIPCHRNGTVPKGFRVIVSKTLESIK